MGTPVRWMRWDPARADGTPALVDFLMQDPQSLFWVATSMLDDQHELVITKVHSKDEPLRVPPGMWVHYDGHNFSWFEKGPDHAG